MTLKMYTVYDAKINAYMRPFFMQTKGEALRGWIDIVNDETTMFAKHPEDYTLFELGEWEDQKGEFTQHITPISVGNALEYKKPKITALQN